MRRVHRYVGLTVLSAAACAWLAVSGTAQEAAPIGEWRAYGGNVAQHRYSPLDRSTGQLLDAEVAWRFQDRLARTTPRFTSRLRR